MNLPPLAECRLSLGRSGPTGGGRQGRQEDGLRPRGMDFGPRAAPEAGGTSGLNPALPLPEGKRRGIPP